MGSLSTAVLHFSSPLGKVSFSCLKTGISSPSLEFTNFTRDVSGSIFSIKMFQECVEVSRAVDGVPPSFRV